MLWAQPASAYDFTTRIDATSWWTGRVCPINRALEGAYPEQNIINYGLTKRIVICVKENVVQAVYKFLVPFSAFLSSTIAAALTLAVAFWGVGMMTGRQDAPVRGMFVLAVKIGAVVMFTASFGASYFLSFEGGLFGALLDAMEWLLTVVTSYICASQAISCPVGSGSLVVWDSIDYTLESLIGGIFPLNGSAPGFTLSFGLTGFLLTCLFSGTIGIFIALLGFYLVIKFIFALIRAMYIFIIAYIAFSLMILVSPIFITLILFRPTKAYFEKWYRLTFSFALQPVLLFAYLAMLVAAFDTVVYTGDRSLYRALAGDHFSDPNFQLGASLIGAQANGKYAIVENAQGEFAVKLDPEQVAKDLHIGTVDTGVAGVIGEVITTDADWTGPGGIFGFLNRDPNTGQTTKNFFKVDVPTKVVDWETLAAWSGASNVTSYLVNLLLTLIMAVITAYIFFTMLDYLPFIGSGIAGDSGTTMPIFGVNSRGNNLGVPGSSSFTKLRDNLSRRFGVGGGQ